MARRCRKAPVTRTYLEHFIFHVLENLPVSVGPPLPLPQLNVEVRVSPRLTDDGRGAGEGTGTEFGRTNPGKSRGPMRKSNVESHDKVCEKYHCRTRLNQLAIHPCDKPVGTAMISLSSMRALCEPRMNVLRQRLRHKCYGSTLQEKN